jgi:DNA-directed RNA polymerase specialized sigma24 family protein
LTGTNVARVGQHRREDSGSCLTETHRAVVELRYPSECTLDEVAELLSISSRDELHRGPSHAE